MSFDQLLNYVLYVGFVFTESLLLIFGLIWLLVIRPPAQGTVEIVEATSTLVIFPLTGENTGTFPLVNEGLASNKEVYPLITNMSLVPPLTLVPALDNSALITRDMTLSDLKEIAAQNQIPKCSRMRKQDLFALLLSHPGLTVVGSSRIKTSPELLEKCA